MKNLNEYTALTNFVKQNSCFGIYKNELICDPCCKTLNYYPRQGVKTLNQHMLGATHIRRVATKLRQTSLDEICSFSELNSTFDKELMIAFADANMPLYGLEVPSFREFLEKWTSQKVHGESWHRKDILPAIYQVRKNKVFESLKGKDLYILFDETTDANGCYLLNIMGGECNKEARSTCYLLRTIELNKTNSETVSQEILNLVNEILDQLS